MDENTKWAAVVGRDSTYDGIFVYCVRTTKIYCRPICKARLARRSNVEFRDNAAQAEAAGYRACKRCQPQLPSFTPEADKIKKACDLLLSLPPNAPLPGLERLAQEAGLTKHHFHRLFKRETGLTPREYALQSRSESTSEATESAAMTPLTPLSNAFGTPAIREIDSLAFSSMDEPLFADHPKTPSATTEYNSFVVYHSIIETTFGILLVAFQDQQICKLELGTNQSELLQSLESSYPTLYYLHSPVEEAGEDQTPSLQRQIDGVVEALERPSGKMLDVPMSLSLEEAETNA